MNSRASESVPVSVSVSAYNRLATWFSLGLLPAAWISFELARALPEWTETLFAGRLYPAMASLMALGPRGLSLAEWVVLPLLAGAVWLLYRSTKVGESLFTRITRLVLVLWTLLGIGAWVFLLSWGFHYARDSLAERLAMNAHRIEIDEGEVLDLARRAAASASSLYSQLPSESQPRSAGQTSRLPMSFEKLSVLVDDSYSRLSLPGDLPHASLAPAKRLRSSLVFSHLGISGIFIPFTGEPSVNGLQPDPALPMVVAHEKAHQRGITHEGEASFAGYMACSLTSSPVYMRYAAALYATRVLIGAASRYASPDDVSAAWDALSEGPRADAVAIYEFWERYEGSASRTASRINDSYLRAMRVPDGAQSYGTVVELLVALDRAGKFRP
jgi:hypothetical protein